MSHSIRKIILLILSSSLIFTVSVGRADDTEIYFSAGSATESVLRPNLLFILDTSGSMIFNTTDSGQTRLGELQDAMETVLDSLTDVNVGLMRFNDAQPQEGGPVIFPINFIDGNVAEVVGDSGQSTVTEIVNTAFLDSDSDDGEEVISSGEVSLTDLVLDAFDFGGTQSVVGSTQTFPITLTTDDSVEETTGFGFFLAGPGVVVSWPENIIDDDIALGLRFTGITVPQGATIGSAFIDLTVSTQQTNTTNTTIVGQNVGDAAAIDAPSFLFGGNFGSFDITSRTSTSASVNWNGMPADSAGSVSTSPDIVTIVQEIIDRADWASGQDMFFRFENTSPSNAIRAFRVSETNPTDAPQLRILIPGSGTAVEGDDQMIALRFTDLDIPQGATLTEAVLTLTPSAAPATGLESTWEISAEQTDDSEALEDSVANISSRSSGGTSVSWTLGASDLITQDEPEESIDIKAVIQDVVDRAGWCLSLIHI